MHSTSASQTDNLYVVDSWPLIERYLRHWSSQRFESLLTATIESNTRLLLHEINLGEVYYLVAKEQGELIAKQILDLVEQLAIEIVPVQAGDAMRAASLKAVHPVSYADCFCANLARQHRAPVLTGDKDFLKLESAGILTVHWLGA